MGEALDSADPASCISGADDETVVVGERGPDLPNDTCTFKMYMWEGE